ncbi:MAG: hypothetical protein KCHDKBKB_01753 [Elusimicrobia bacterium]|nr:hypothetical protein [Elusimicrobiota bacterium]
MGIDLIRLNNEQKVEKPIESRLKELSKLSFVTHHVTNPSLSIWMMSLTPKMSLFPWWTYKANLDEDIKRLSDLWSVTSDQGLFDCLFLSQFKRLAGSSLYMIAPGYLRTEGWDKLTDQARQSYLHGQSCVFRLEGAYNSKLSINWVPFAQPQVIIKDPSFSALWSMFVGSRNDDVANSIGFFQLSDIKKLPQVTNLLIRPNNNRSQDLATVVDWYALYSSPLNPDHASCAVVYSSMASQLTKFSEFQLKFDTLINSTRETLRAEAIPYTVFKILSRYIAI